MSIRVGVFGAAGKMGRTVCAAVAGDPECELVAAVDPHHEGLDVHTVTGVDAPGLVVGGQCDSMADAEVDVVVDFTEAAAARENLRWCAENGVHAVVGTTGLGEPDYQALRDAFTRSNCVVAPNFAIGALLLMRLAEVAAPYFDSVEVIELHHETKIDAPSGTAMLTLERIAKASSSWTPDPTTHEVVPGARGGKGPGDIAVHSVRLRGLMAHEEVLFGTTGQMLTIRHDSFDRSSFMPGVLLAVKRIASRPGVTIGLDVLLDL
jgi:4-hydroxy-tetrahydrodipicolinate reductase